MRGEVSCKTKSVGPDWGPAATAYGKGRLQGESPEEWSVIGSVGATGEFLLGRAGVITMADFFCIGVGLAVMHLRHKQPNPGRWTTIRVQADFGCWWVS